MLREHITTDKLQLTTDTAPVSCQLSVVSCSHSRGFGLVEIMVAASILSMSMLAVSTFFQSTLKVSRSTSDRNQASYLLEEGVEALKILRDTSYANNLLNVSTTTPRYLEWVNASSTWAATTTEILIDSKFRRKFTIADVTRDNSTFDISTSTTGTTYDPNVKLATVTVTWPDGGPISDEVYSGGLLSKLSPEVVTVGGLYADESGIAVSPDNASIYAVKSNQSRIYMYSRNTTTGMLTVLSPTAYLSTGSQPRDVAVAPGGLHVYVANYGGSSISGYSRNAGTSMLTSLGAAYTTGANTFPPSLVISPDGLFLYALGEDGRIYRFARNTSNGALSGLTTVADVVGGYQAELIISPDGTSMYCVGYIGGGVLYGLSRNTTTGALTSLGEMPLAAGTEAHYGIAISPDGLNVYIANFDSNSLSMYARNTTSGMLTLLTPETVQVETNPQGVVVSNDGKTVYVANFNSNSISQFLRNSTTGVLTANTPATILTYNYGNPDAIAISPNDASLYAVDVYWARISMYSRTAAVYVSGGISMASSSIKVYITNLFSN